jgi:hypothetical protein
VTEKELVRAAAHRLAIIRHAQEEGMQGDDRFDQEVHRRVSAGDRQAFEETERNSTC